MDQQDLSVPGPRSPRGRNDIPPDLGAALQGLCNAWHDPGPHPLAHHHQIDRLRTEWPLLHTYIKELMLLWEGIR